MISMYFWLTKQKPRHIRLTECQPDLQGVRGALEQPLTLLERYLRVFPLGDVLERGRDPDQGALRVQHRDCR